MDYEVAPQSGIPLRCDFGGVIRGHFGRSAELQEIKIKRTRKAQERGVIQKRKGLMAFSSLSSGLEVSNNSICSKSSLETVEFLKSQNEQLIKDLKKSELMVLELLFSSLDLLNGVAKLLFSDSVPLLSVTLVLSFNVIPSLTKQASNAAPSMTKQASNSSRQKRMSAKGEKISGE
nr:hypothetical protein [Tanacetum cinerariifolium]